MTKSPNPDKAIAFLSQRIKTCRLCRDNPQYFPALPHEPRPVAILSQHAKIAIAGQAPGLKVHQTGRPFYDRSGQRLRDWLGVDEVSFYNPNYFAIIPMGFCFPGYDTRKSDRPPRHECRETWHEQVFSHMPQIEWVIAVGGFAQNWHIPDIPYPTLTERVYHWRELSKKRQKRGYFVLPLPHPSWRNNVWIKKNPWFEKDLVPHLRAIIAEFIPR